MSDALNYLVKVRGDALDHYFAFLKDSGKHLDPEDAQASSRSSPRSIPRPRPASSST